MDMSWTEFCRNVNQYVPVENDSGREVKMTAFYKGVKWSVPLVVGGLVALIFQRVTKSPTWSAKVLVAGALTGWGVRELQNCIAANVRKMQEGESLLENVRGQQGSHFCPIAFYPDGRIELGKKLPAWLRIGKGGNSQELQELQNENKQLKAKIKESSDKFLELLNSRNKQEEKYVLELNQYCDENERLKMLIEQQKNKFHTEITGWQRSAEKYASENTRLKSKLSSDPHKDQEIVDLRQKNAEIHRELIEVKEEFNKLRAENKTNIEEKININREKLSLEEKIEVLEREKSILELRIKKLGDPKDLVKRLRKEAKDLEELATSAEQSGIMGEETIFTTTTESSNKRLEKKSVQGHVTTTSAIEIEPTNERQAALLKMRKERSQDSQFTPSSESPSSFQIRPTLEQEGEIFLTKKTKKKHPPLVLGTTQNIYKEEKRERILQLDPLDSPEEEK